MFYALPHLQDSFFADNVHKVVAFAPCFVNPPWSPTGSEKYYENSMYKFPSIGVYDEYGPNWDVEYARICNELTWEGRDYASCTTCQPGSVQTSAHWNQNSYTGRFQEYIPLDEYVAGKRISPLVDVASIDKVEIAMFAGRSDVTCPYDRAVKFAGIIGSAVTHFESIDDADHMYFAGANSEWFMGVLKEQL